DQFVVLVIEYLETVQVVQIPEKGAILAVDLERVERFVAAGVTGRLEIPERAILEMRKERTGIVDADFLHFAGERVFAFFDERLGDCGDVGEAAVQPNGGVNAVGEEVASDAAARDLHVQSPKSGAALRQVFRDG